MQKFSHMQQKNQPFWFNSSPESEFTILIAEDEAHLRHLMTNSLEKLGYTVHVAANGQEALDLFRRVEVDLVILDIVMPVLDGFDTCRAIRAQSSVPVIMLTALSRPDDIVTGFELGADDYITKPFTFREVEIRLHAIFRRIGWIENPQYFPIIAFDGFVFDDMARQAIIDDKIIPLTPIECKLLSYLMSKPAMPVDKNDLFQFAWGYEVTGGKNLVEVAMRRLRQKIEKTPSDPQFLVTVRSAGYKFMPPGEPDDGIQEASQAMSKNPWDNRLA